MKHTVTKQQFLYSILYSSLISLILITLFFSALNSAVDNSRKEERLNLMEQFLKFQTSAEHSIIESVHLLDGYKAYLEVNPEMTELESEVYLDHLLEGKSTLIRNIGILEDTTVIWNYPKEGNEDAIGVDLATIETQREDVLNAKEQLIKTFIGPVDLVQGGQGFIVRLPLLHDKQYWGQISIVLDADQYMRNLDQSALAAGLNIGIYNADTYPNGIFFGDPTILSRNGLLLDLDILNSRWRVAAEPIDGWQATIPYLFELRLISVIVSLFIGFLIFMVLHTRQQLEHQALTDPLTHLGNRHALYMEMAKLSKMSHQLPVMIMMFDINTFKQINDQFGHDAGDTVLTEFARHLKDLPCMQKKIYRLGGDEFLMILIEPPKSCPRTITRDYIRHLVSFTFTKASHSVHVVPSIGIVLLPDEGISLEAAIDLADQRMYEDKDQMRLRD